MRVLYFSVIFEYLGSETYYTSEVKSLIENYPDIEVLVYSVNCEKNQVIRYDKNIIWYQRKSLRNLNTWLLFLQDMVKIFTKFNPDIIHSVYVIESIIIGIVGQLFRKPMIFHSRGMDFNYYPFINFKSRILLKIANWLSKRIITVSKTMKQDGIRLKIPESKMIPIYDGIELDTFNPENEKPSDQNKGFEIIHIGRFSPEKCHDMIIDTCKRLKDNKINFHLTFIGDGPLLKKIKDLVSKNNLDNEIDFTGWINHDDIPGYLEKSNLFILPSTTEGMPISVLEAMSMELPVILTKVGGMPELIQEQGGILIEPNNSDQLFDGILYYINNPEKIKSDGKKNREFILKYFNWNHHSKLLVNIYKTLIKGW